MVTAKNISNFLNAPLVGNNVSVTGIGDIGNIQNNRIYFCWTKGKKLDRGENTNSVFVLNSVPKYDINYIVVSSPRLSFVKVAHNFFSDKLVPTISDYATISPTAKIGTGVTIQSGVIIEDDVEVGDSSYIEHGAIIKKRTIIGKKCKIGPMAVIGHDGFGFDFEDGIPIEIPHFGRAIIGDFVDIRARCDIACGVLCDTRIGNYTKINGGVKIAHNVIVGERCIIAGGTINGSCVIGDDCWLSPDVVLQNKVTIGSGSLIGTGAVVVANISKNVVAYGVPARVVRNRS